MSPGPTELIIILVIVIVIFGATRLPQIGEGLGKGIQNFRAGIKEERKIDVAPESDRENEATHGRS